MSPSPARPLVIRFGAFGDMVLMIPPLKLLQARFGEPCDVVGSGSWTPPLLARVPAVRDLRLLTSRRAPYWFNRSQQQLVAELRRRPPGPVFVFEPDEKPLSWLKRAGIGPEWICTLREFPRRPDEHILEHTMRLARATPRALEGRLADASSLPQPDTRPELSATDRQDAADWLAARQLASAPVVLLQPGNKKTMKRGDPRRASNVDYWPEANWAEVCRGVRTALPAAKLVLCGTPAERPLADEIVAQLSASDRDHVVVATDDLPIPRLLALQERAHSMISVNTGPAHSAAAMGCPLVVLFTRHPHRAANYYAMVPTTGPMRIVEPVDTRPETGLEQISPAAVLDAWRALLAG